MNDDNAKHESEDEKPIQNCIKLDHVAGRVRASLLLLPDELLTIVLSQLYFDIFKDGEGHTPACTSRGKPLQRCCCRLSDKRMLWYWYSLPLVHPRIFALLAPAPMPIIEIPQAGISEYQKIDDMIAYMACPRFASNLAHVRHIRFDYRDLARRYNSLAPISTLQYVANMALIFLSARNLQTLELGYLESNPNMADQVVLGHQEKPMNSLQRPSLSNLI